jgi:hypothetical protein
MSELGLQQIYRSFDRFLVSTGLSVPETAAVFLILLCITVPWIRIFRKAGYSRAAGLLMFVPPINIFMFLLFAYHDWPIEREREAGTAHSWRH